MCRAQSPQNDILAECAHWGWCSVAQGHVKRTRCVNRACSSLTDALAKRPTRRLVYILERGSPKSPDGWRRGRQDCTEPNLWSVQSCGACLRQLGFCGQGRQECTLKKAGWVPGACGSVEVGRVERLGRREHAPNAATPSREKDVVGKVAQREVP